MQDYQIITDSTADSNKEMMAGLPEVKVVPMQIQIGGREYTYGQDGEITAEEFYRIQREGNFAHTSSINPFTYTSYFESCLQAGKDVLYLGLSSALSGTVQSAQTCAEELMSRYPGRRIVCIDTLCASVGEGFLVREAARMQAQGLTMDELVAWVMEHRLQVCHWFTVDIFDHLKHGGRVNAATAMVGTLLKVKPLLHVDENGGLTVMGKPRGRKQAIAAQMKKMEQDWQPEMGKLVVVGHGSNPEGAEKLRQAVEAHFPEAEIHIADIGPVIGAHTGPGMLALIFWGTTR